MKHVSLTTALVMSSGLYIFILSLLGFFLNSSLSALPLEPTVVLWVFPLLVSLLQGVSLLHLGQTLLAPCVMYLSKHGAAWF